MTSNSSDRRTGPRTKGRIRVAYGENEVSVSDLSEDISTKGLFVKTPYPLDIGTVLQIEIEFQIKNRAATQNLQLSGRVTRAETAGEAKGMGVEFINLNAKDKSLLELLIRNLHRKPEAD